MSKAISDGYSPKGPQDYEKLANEADILAEVAFEEAGLRSIELAPYMGPATLMNAPIARSLEGVDIALVGVPFDLGVTNRAGARHGPKQLRDISSIAVNGIPKHHVSEIMPFKLCNIVDYGDIHFEKRFSLDDGIAEIEAFFHKLLDQNVVPLAAGGDHSISYPILKAVGRNEPVGLVQIDAHCDTMGPVKGSKFHHGGPFRNAVLSGVLDPTRTVQIGIRGQAEALWDFSYQSGMRVIHVEEFYDMGVEAVIDEVRHIIGHGPTYITIDVDGIDPAFAPGTGTPVVGGLTPLDVQRIIRSLRGANLIGGDVVEVAPPFDLSGNTAMVGATMMWEILCVLSHSISVNKLTA